MAEEEVKEEDCKDRTGFFPSQTQCDKYYECRNSELSTHLCPDGLVYDSSHFTASFQLDSSGSTGKCSYPFSIDCSGREELQVASPSKSCSRKNGYFAHEDCDKYFFCNDGAANLYDCPGGLVFAPDKGQCTWIGEANRPGCESKDKIEFNCPEVGPSEHTRYPDPQDCQRFYVCIAGNAHHNSCPQGLVFHPGSLACDRQEAVTGACSSWYNSSSVEGLSLPDTLPTPATARPGPEKPEAFINRRRPPMKILNQVREETKPEDNRKVESDTTKQNQRKRTRVRGSVLRPGGVISRHQQQGNDSEEKDEDTTSVTTDQEDTQRRSNTRVRTRTRISLSSMPNIMKGEKSTSQSRSRVRGKVNIRPILEAS